MTDATFNDLSHDGTTIMRRDKAYRVTVKSLGNNTELEFDTDLTTKFPTLRDAIGMALTNGKQWLKITWETDAETGRKKKRSEPVLDDTQKKEKD